MGEKSRIRFWVDGDVSIWVFRVRIGKSTCIMLDFQMCNGTNHCSVATVND